MYDFLFDIKFLCVEIDEDAKTLFKYWNLREKTNTPSRVNFVSFSRMQAIIGFEKNPTIENHHIAIHWVLIDKAYYLLSLPYLNDEQYDSLCFILNETLKCSKDLRVINLLNTYKQNKLSA